MGADLPTCRSSFPVPGSDAKKDSGRGSGQGMEAHHMDLTRTSGKVRREEFVFGGYLIVRGVEKPDWISDKVRCSPIWAITDCICGFIPCHGLLPGTSLSSEEQREFSHVTGLKAESVASLKSEIEEMLAQKTMGWPNTFISLESASALYRKYLQRAENHRILGIAFSGEAAKELVADAAAPPRIPCGMAELLVERQEIPANSRILGFEILGLEYCGSFHSFLCNGLEADYSEKLSITLNETGRIDTWEEARRAADYTNDESVGAEPVPWYPCLVFEPTTFPRHREA